jgi:hypothetical protein
MMEENHGELIWKTWRDILLGEFGRRLEAAGAKGYRIAPARKAFTAIFIQVKGSNVSVPDVLPEAIEVIKQTACGALMKEYDDIAMMGHRIGVVENGLGLKQYLQDIRPLLQPAGCVLFTVIDSGAVNLPVHCSGTVQFQQADLIGPFYNMLRIKIDTLKNQTAAANWQCEIIHRQDDSNYCALLRLTESL